MGTIILPDDPNWKQPLIMGDPFEQGLTPKSAQEKRNKEFDKQRESEGATFKYANSAIAHHPEPWLKNAQATGVSNMMTNPMWFSPLHTPQNWQIASKRREIYQWSFINDCYLTTYGSCYLDNLKNVYTKWQNDFASRSKMYIQNDKGEKAKPDICTKRYVEKKANRIKVLGNPHPIEVTHDHKCIVIKREDVKCPKGIAGTSKNCISHVCSPTCERAKCNDYKNKDYKVATVDAQDIRKGDYILCPFPTEVKESTIKTKEQARFAGHLASDGWISQNKLSTTNICMHPDETKYVLSSVSPVFESFGATVKQESFGDNKTIVVRSGKKSLHEYGSKLVKGKSINKHFTEEVMLLDPELQKHVLGAYIQSDGSYNKTIEQIEITTISKHLAYQLQIMCYRNKILAFCNKQPRRQNKGSFKTTNLEYYIVSIPKTFVYTLQDYVPGKIPECIYIPQQKIGDSSVVNFVKNGKNISRIYNRFFWKNYVVTPVVSNTSFDYKGDVYDIRVPPTHAITANGIAIHQCRFFYDSEPKVAAAIDFYSRFPMNGFKLECKDPKILKFFEHKAAKRLSLNENCKMISSECHMLGDVFIHMDIECPLCQGIGVNPDSGEICNHPGGNFKKMRILNPDWIEVQQNIMADEPSIVFVPDEELKRIVFYKQPKNIYDRIPNAIKSLVLQNKPIPLSNRTTSHLKYMPVPYGTYGTSLIRRLFTTLAYKTKIMTANWIVAERLILPVRVVQIGSDDRPATSADIADVQQQLAATANDPNLTIVTHHNFKYEWYGACHDDQTEVLTDSGFKTYDQVDIAKDKISCYNVYTNSIECIYATDKHVYDYVGELIHFSGRNLDILVTPNHKMLYQSNDNLWKTKDASKINRGSKLISINKSGKSKHSIVQHINRVTYKGKVWCFTVPTGFFVTRRNGKITIQGNSGKILQITQEMEYIGKEILDGFMLNQSLLNGEMCLTPDHQVLTTKGYMPIAEVELSEDICLWDDRDDCFIYEKPLQKIKYENVEYIYEIKSGSKTLLKCSAKHNIVLQPFGRYLIYEKTGKHLKVPAGELHERMQSNELTSCVKMLMKDGSYLAIDSIQKIPYGGDVYCFQTSTGYFVAKYDNIEFISSNSGYQCHDAEQTEVLTRSGFKKYDDITEEDEIGTFNKDTEELEYHNYTDRYDYDYDGEMIHFSGKRLDCLVTPNHRMLVRNSRTKNEWKVKLAEDVTSSHQFRSVVKWNGRNAYPKTVQIDDEHILSLEDYIKLVCYFATEGSVRKETRKERSTFGEPCTATIYQSEKGKAFAGVKSLADSISYRVRHYEKYDMFCIHNKKLATHLVEVCGNHSSCKRIPAWIKELPEKYLKLALFSLIDGDGYYHTKTQNGGWQCGFEVKSKQLAEDLFELAFKCGYAPLMVYRKNRELWTVDFSDAMRGRFPHLNSKYIQKQEYHGKIFCFTVPNGFFVTRRNGKISIHGNSAQVGVETLIRRIESWRHTLAEWIQERIFKPIAEMQGFIDEEESEEIGELSFIYPEIKWNDLNLKDKTQYFQLLNQLHDKQLISSQTLLEEMDFKWDQEVKRMRYEQAQAGPMGMGAGLGGAGGAGGMPLGGGGGGAGGAPMPGEAPPGMAGGVGGMDMGMGGGGMPGAMPATAGVGGKIMKPGKEKKFQQQQTDGQQMNAMPVKLTSIEQKVADTLVGLCQMYRINPQKIRVQFPVQNPHGGPPYQLDFALPDWKLNVECLLPGTIIETDNGYKKVEDVLLSDKLFDRYGKHTKIVHKFVQEYDGEVAKICAMGMLNLDVTSSHKLWISKPKKTRVVRNEPKITRTREYLQPDTPQFICVKEAEVGDYVIIPKRKTNGSSHTIKLQQYIDNNRKRIPEQIDLDVKLSRLLGLYIAEGCAFGSSIVFSFSENEKDYINETEILMDEIFGIKLSKIYLGNGAARICFQSSPLAKFFNEVCGKYARNKKVPSIMFDTSEENIKSFIRGVMDGDGCIRNESEWRIQTSSKSLALGIQQLCATIGVWAPIVISRVDGIYNIRGRSGIQHSLFEITINWDPQKRKYREDEDYFYVPIRKIVFSSYSGIRYNFETEDHSYCVNNMVSKNCDGDIWHSNPDQASDDQKRDTTLAQRGWTVLRFDDKAIEETPQAVRNTIGKFINTIIESRKSKTASVDSSGVAKLYTARSGELHDLRDEYNKFIKSKFSGEFFGGDGQQQQSSFSKTKYASTRGEEFKQ